MERIRYSLSRSPSDMLDFELFLNLVDTCSFRQDKKTSSVDIKKAERSKSNQTVRLKRSFNRNLETDPHTASDNEYGPALPTINVSFVIGQIGISSVGG
jgi:hypothetical protein